jgi:hypothetical protein
MKSKSKLIALVSSILVIASITGCSAKITSKSNKTTVDKKVIEIDGAKKADVKIDMGIGELIIDKSTDKMMEGEFTYTKADWKPEISYKVNGDEGTLNIKQPSSMNTNINIGINKDEYKWELSLNKDIPTNLDIDMGVGEGNINLREVNLKELNIKSGVGKMSVDLSGDYKEDVEVDIEGGVGETTLYLPKNIGVRVKAEKGLGSIKEGKLKKESNNVYVNDSYGKTKNSIQIEVEAGIGEIKLELK